MNTKHTPGSWTAGLDPCPTTHNRWFVEKRERGYKTMIAFVYGDPKHMEADFQGSAEANARRIALCCNMHDELVDISKRLASLCPSEEGLGGHAPIGAFVQLGSRARAVLAKLPAAP